MNKESIERLKKLVSEDDSIVMDKPDKELDAYIMYRAKKELKSGSGYLADDIVVGWAKHFYVEDNETIKNEMGKPIQTSTVSKETKPKPKPKEESKEQLSLFEL